MRVDSPTLVGRGVGVNADATTLCHGYLAEPARSLCRSFY
jgi:hypothetical protein